MVRKKDKPQNTPSFGDLTPSLTKSCFSEDQIASYEVKDNAVRLIEAYFRLREPKPISTPRSQRIPNKRISKPRSQRRPMKKTIFEEARIKINSVHTKHFLSHFVVDGIKCGSFKELLIFLSKVEKDKETIFIELIKDSYRNQSRNKELGDFAKLKPSLEISCFSGSEEVKNKALRLIQAYFELHNKGDRFPTRKKLFHKAGFTEKDINSTFFLNHFKVGNIQCNTFQEWFTFLNQIAEEEQSKFMNLIENSPPENKNVVSFSILKPSLKQRFFWGSNQAKDQAVQLMVNYFKLRNEGNTSPTEDELFPESTSKKNSIKIERLLRQFKVNGIQCMSLSGLCLFLNRIQPIEEILYIQWVEYPYTSSSSSLTSTEKVPDPSAITLPNSTATEADYNVSPYSTELEDLFSTMEQLPNQNQFPSLFSEYDNDFLPDLELYPGGIELNTEPSQENGENTLIPALETKKRSPTWREQYNQPSAKKKCDSNNEDLTFNNPDYYLISGNPAKAESRAQPTNVQNYTKEKSQHYYHAKSRSIVFAKKALPPSQPEAPNTSSFLSIMNQFSCK